MATSQKMADMAQQAMENLTDTDYWASPTTQIFAFIGLLYITLKIFSFWRLIASLFILPGTNVSTLTKTLRIRRANMLHSSQPLAKEAVGQ